jgi:2-oxoglutarate ferredoxin oxidoreductase subunit beta
MHGGFVARGFSGLEDHLSGLIERAIAHRGFSLVDVLQPCVSFNKVNTFAWYKERCYELPETYDPTDWESAVKTAHEWGDRIPVGVIYKHESPPLEERLGRGVLVGRELDRNALKKVVERYS